MNNLKITFTGEIVRRWKETTKAGKEMVYVAIKVQRGEWCDVFRIKARDIETVKPYEIGTKVRVEAFVGSREWKSPEGKVSYFVDLNLYAIALAESAATVKDAPAAVETTDVEDLPF